jgi:SAM-dependent methyltransferase
MKRTGLHKPTVEDAIEMSGIEILHPGGSLLTQRTAEIANLRPGMKVLDVSSGRGTLAIAYAKEFGVEVIGLDISEEMVTTATERAKQAGVAAQVRFRLGDSQHLPFEADTFDAVINECAVGIPDDSQAVLNEMVRVAKPGASLVIHESTWRGSLSTSEKQDFAERYGTTPLALDEGMGMLRQAGFRDIVTEFDEWSKPEMFWKVRLDREVRSPSQVLTWPERARTAFRVWRRYGVRGVLKSFQNERVVVRAILEGKLGYCLFKGAKGENLNHPQDPRTEGTIPAMASTR